MNQSQQIIKSLSEDAFLEAARKLAPALVTDEDLATVAKMVTALMKRFKITRVGEWKRFLVDNPKGFKSALAKVMKVVSRDFKVNDKGALNFIEELVQLKISVARV